MEIAAVISSADMQNIAIGIFDIKSPSVSHVAHSTNRNPNMMNYELLRTWRNKDTENDREV